MTLSASWKDLLNPENIVTTDRGSVWRFFNDENGKPQFKFYSDTRSLMSQALKWQGAHQGATYHRPDGVMFTFDVVIPKRLVKRTLRLLGIAFKKNEALVKASHRLLAQGKLRPGFTVSQRAKRGLEFSKHRGGGK